ncbi:hypothetical protein BDV95DRAFT_610902 [Massariosphaeria phaeospora]|uniref:Uncharacterized protein n=1 Tax=Massariosphaeria phaeospora TaxID=100035 RepID=A0A7C8I561_9PLEO|nr:hypothetical protein BDV95DRAFT_610902 [Massariosphaeria phaeospora]
MELSLPSPVRPAAASAEDLVRQLENLGYEVLISKKSEQIHQTEELDIPECAINAVRSSHDRLHRFNMLRDVVAQGLGKRMELQKMSRWLFAQDRQNPRLLNEIENQEQCALMRYQQDLRTKSPGEYLYLCFMAIPRELREMIYSAKFKNIPVGLKYITMMSTESQAEPA